MIAAETPPPPPPAAEVMVVSRREGSELVATHDLPLALVKGVRREEALVRQAVFITSSVLVTQPAAGGPESYRWSYAGFLQRQVCFTSMTGLFSCTEAQAEPLTDKAWGEAPLVEADAFPLADAARQKLADGLRARSSALFAADRRANVDPIFRASGVVASAPAAAPRR